MNEMRLAFYLEMASMRKAALAKIVGTSPQNINDWIKRRDVWVYCDDQYEIEKIEDRQAKLLWSK